MFKTLECASGPRGILGEAPPQDLAEHMHALWVGFACDGLLPWEPYGTEQPVFRIAEGRTVTEDAMPPARFLPQ